MLKRFLKWLLHLFLNTSEKPVDKVKQDSVPDTKTEIVRAGRAVDKRPYMTSAMIELLRLIRLHESGKAGYDADFRNDSHYGDLSRYTFNTVRALSRKQVTRGEPSSAIGGYQFLTKTLDSLKQSIPLSGEEKFTHELQDDLAVALMIRRGYMKFMRGEISATTFANNLAKEWASLPVVTACQGAHRYLKPGQSYYAGDGLNKAFHKPEVILAAVNALKGH